MTLTPLAMSSYVGHLDVVELLLEASANINQLEKYGANPLYLASQQGHIDVVKALLKRKEVKINQPDDNGSNLLCSIL